MVFILACAAFVGGAVLTTCHADTSAVAFLHAVRAGRVEDASRLATPELRPFLGVLTDARTAGLAETERGRMLLLLHARDAGVHHYGGNFSTVCGHLTCDGDTDNGWMVLRRVDGAWLVADLGSASLPELCQSSGD